jgi:hypothetical protein
MQTTRITVFLHGMVGADLQPPPKGTSLMTLGVEHLERDRRPLIVLHNPNELPQFHRRGSIPQGLKIAGTL